MQGFAEYVDYDGLGLAELVRTREVADRGSGSGDRTHRAAEPDLERRCHQSLRRSARRCGALDAEAPFAGVPFLLKDLGGAQAGVPLSAGSRFFAHAPAPADAEIVNRHKRAGWILGAYQHPEFGLSATTEPVLFGPTRNPWDRPGPPAARAAARRRRSRRAWCRSPMPDGGGSIRIPASCCVFGMKTTRNRNTLAPYAGESLAGCAVEHVVSRSVRDSAAALDATAGRRRRLLRAATRAPVPRGGGHAARPPAHRAHHKSVRRRPGASGLHRGREAAARLRGARSRRRGSGPRLRHRGPRCQLQPDLRGRGGGQHPDARAHSARSSTRAVSSGSPGP